VFRRPSPITEAKGAAFYYECGAPQARELSVQKMIEWLRSYLRPIANDAAAHWFTAQDDFWYADLIELGPAICRSLGWPEECGRAAVVAEGQAARTRFMVLREKMAQAVRQAAVDREPGAVIIEVAEAALAETDFYLPREAVIDFCRRVAASTRRARG
jgi:hypothetical protein